MHTTRLGPRQARIHTFITLHVSDVGYPPSIREIAEHVGLTSTATVHHHLRALEAKGLLRRTAGRSRALVVTDLDAA